MAQLDSFERKVLFRLTRVLALLITFALLIGIVIAAIALVKAFGRKSNTVTTSVTALENIKMPSVLQKYFSNNAENSQILLQHIGSLTPEAQQEYVDNLAEVASKAESTGTDVEKAMSRYVEVQDKRILEEKAAQADKKSRRLYLAAAIWAGLTIVALNSLILVLLAIERNTRILEAYREPSR
jgi:hypothetical protein